MRAAGHAALANAVLQTPVRYSIIIILIYYIYIALNTNVSKRFIYHICHYPGHRTHFQATLIVQFPLPGEDSLPSCLIGAGKFIHNNRSQSYRVPIYTPGWRAAIWIKCLAEGQKVPGIDVNRTHDPLVQSRESNPLYHGTSNN